MSLFLNKAQLWEKLLGVPALLRCFLSSNPWFYRVASGSPTNQNHDMGEAGRPDREVDGPRLLIPHMQQLLHASPEYLTSTRHSTHDGDGERSTPLCRGYMPA